MRILFLAALAVAPLITPVSARADNLLCHGVIFGNETIWRGTREAARRGARENWRDAVRTTPGLGPSYEIWGWASRPDLGRGDGSDGYYCRTTKVWFDSWHKCSAWAAPCNYNSNEAPRSAEIELELDLAREEAPLEITGKTLEIERVTRNGECPAAFILTARIYGKGTRGGERVTLHSSAGDGRTVGIAPEDFQATGDGRRVAIIDFVRTFDAAADNRYWLTSGPATNEPQRAVPPKRLRVNCRSEGIGGLTTQQEQPSLD